jgi:serine/threonine protein kinase
VSNISPMHLPNRVGRYVIEGLYSQGGMSRLLLGREESTDTRAIIKILLPCFASDKDLVDRFINEGRILAMSSHRNIVRLYDCGFFSEGPYIAMEFIPGTPLSTIFKVRRLAPLDGLKIFLDVCQGVRHLHGHGIVHGDLKPENILITTTNEVKIIDFGIAKISEGYEASNSVQAHQFLGSPFYMAPEVQKDFQNISTQSDIYSLGVVGYELMTGKFSKGNIDILLLPEQIGEIIERALQMNPQDRYESVDDLISDISSYMLLHMGLKTGKEFDYYFEMYGQLQTKHHALLQSLVPCPGSRMSVAYRCTFQGDGLYFRCVDTGAVQIAIAANSIRSKADGISDCFRLHDAFERFLTDKSDSLGCLDITSVFDELGRQGVDFAYCAVSVHKKSQVFQWTGLGFGTLFTIRDDLVSPVGLSNQTFKKKYQQGDRFLIVGCPLHSEASVALVQDSTHMVASKSPEEITGYVLDRILVKDPRFFENHPVCLVSIFSS